MNMLRRPSSPLGRRWRGTIGRAGQKVELKGLHLNVPPGAITVGEISLEVTTLDQSANFPVAEYEAVSKYIAFDKEHRIGTPAQITLAIEEGKFSEISSAQLMTRILHRENDEWEEVETNVATLEKDKKISFETKILYRQMVVAVKKITLFNDLYIVPSEKLTIVSMLFRDERRAKEAKDEFKRRGAKVVFTLTKEITAFEGCTVTMEMINKIDVNEVFNAVQDASVKVTQDFRCHETHFTSNTSQREYESKLGYTVWINNKDLGFQLILPRDACAGGTPIQLIYQSYFINTINLNANQLAFGNGAIWSEQTDTENASYQRP